MYILLVTRLIHCVRQDERIKCIVIETAIMYRRPSKKSLTLARLCIRCCEALLLPSTEGGVVNGCCMRRRCRLQVKLLAIIMNTF